MLTAGGDMFLPLYGVYTHVMLGAASAFLVLPAIAPGRRTGPIRLLTKPSVLWVGMISYGVYLWHDPLLSAIRGTTAVPTQATGIGNMLLLFLATAVAAIAAAAASWYLVERPAQRLARRARVATPVAAAPGIA
jgi:peptidoglycan/LPS O-acetylase OafA/YrhL